MTEIVDPEILAQAAESMRLNYGDVSDLPLELVNTLANVHYRFHELARARMPSTPDAFEAWSKRAARYGPAAKHAPDMVKQARAVRSNPEDFRFIVGTMIDTMKYRIDPEFALNLPEAERARRRDPSKVDEIPDLSARMGLTKRPAPPDAVAAYGKGDYTTVLRLIRPLADQGQADAQFNLGLMYYRGEGIPQNYVEAMRWCRLAADQGHAFAQSHLGPCTTKATAYRRTSLRRRNGIAALTTKATLSASTISGSCTTMARAYRRTTLRRRNGIAARPTKATLTLNSISASCSTRARAYPKLR
jgi:Sel1 repeat